MAQDDSLTKSVIKNLHDIGGIKIGEFTLKSGIKSPIYFDLRVIVSTPKLMSDVSKLLWKTAIANSVKCDCLCGVPYTALPLTTCISVDTGLPMLMKRKEAKTYGTKQLIEGVEQIPSNSNCLIVEDVVTSGSSVLETAQVLRDVGLTVTNAIVLLDRQHGGADNLSNHSIKLHSVISMNELLTTLKEENRITAAQFEQIKMFLECNKSIAIPEAVKKNLSFSERKEHTSNKISKRLFEIMSTKKTNLSVAVDLCDSSQILKVADEVGPYICVLKLHADIINDFSEQFVTNLSSLSEKHNFLIFEDRKFADIGKTVQLQLTEGRHISSWAHIINAHAIPGPQIVTALEQASEGSNIGCLLIAEMSSAGNLANEQYRLASKKMAEDSKHFVIGFISQSKISSDPGMIHMTPGVKICDDNGDGLGQQYVSPTEAVVKRGADVVIVGRGITQADDCAKAASTYQQAAYKAYESFLS